MSKAIASARTYFPSGAITPLDAARTVIVGACALALIAAGQALPF